LRVPPSQDGGAVIAPAAETREVPNEQTTSSLDADIAVTEAEPSSPELADADTAAWTEPVVLQEEAVKAVTEVAKNDAVAADVQYHQTVQRTRQISHFTAPQAQAVPDGAAEGIRPHSVVPGIDDAEAEGKTTQEAPAAPVEAAPAPLVALQR
jgi:hypothetical protein